MTTKEQYIESFESGWKLAGKLKSKCKGKLTIEVASAGLCLSLAAALTDASPFPTSLLLNAK
jgi:hypothetical protein